MKKALIAESLVFIGAESRNRTGTLSPARDFESRASTYSAISATQAALSLIWDVGATCGTRKEIETYK